MKFQENDTRDHNLEFLQYSPVLIQNKQKCKEFYHELPGLFLVIDKYMICSMGGGNLDDVGRIINKVPPTADGCLPDDEDEVGKIFTSFNLLKLKPTRKVWTVFGYRELFISEILRRP